MATNTNPSDTPGLMVRTVTVEHHKVHLSKKSPVSHSSLPEGTIPSVLPNSSPSHSTTNDSRIVPSSALVQDPSHVPPSIVLVNTSDLPVSSVKENKNERKKVAGLPYCCPWYMLLGMAALIALAIGLGIGITGKSSNNEISNQRVRLNVDLKFDVTGKEVNMTFVSELRCLIANLTNPNLLDRILLTVWVESNGTIVEVDPEHPLNDANDCTVYVDNFGSARRRRMRQLQMVNNSWIMPIDPISVNISAVPPKADDPDDITFVDAIYASTDIQAIAPLTAIAKEGFLIPPTPSSTGTPTPSSTSSASNSASNSPTASTTVSGSNTPSNTPSNSPTPTASETPTGTPTSSTTGTQTPTSSPTGTSSVTPTPTSTGTSTPSNSPSNTGTPTSSETPSSSVTSSNTPTPSVTPTPSSSTLPTPYMVANIWASSMNGNPQYFAVLTDNSKVFFNAETSTDGAELFMSDLTSNNAVLVKDIEPGSSGSAPSDLAALGSIVIFSAYTTTNGREPWRSDGTSAGTYLLKDIYTGSGDSLPTGLIAYNNYVYFTAEELSSGYEMYRTDGTTTGTTLFKDIRASGGANPGYKILCGGNLFFSANDGTNGIELWVTSGTSASTVMVKDIHPTGNAAPQDLVCIPDNGNTLIFFSAIDDTTGREFWKSDGTASGTVRVSDIYTGTSASFPGSFAYLDAGKILFSAATSTTGQELFITDGTTVTLVKDIWTGTSGSSPTYLTVHNGKVIFRAETASGRQLWVSDGTNSGTIRLSDVLQPGPFVAMNNLLYFRGTTTASGTELWRTDGTTASMVMDICPGSTGSQTSYLYPIDRTGGGVVFQATDCTNGRELWLMPKYI